MTVLDDGGAIAGPPPLTVGAAGTYEVDRLVNACGSVGLAGRQHPIGFHLAGQRVTVRLDGAVMQILNHDRMLLRTLVNPLTPADRSRLRDARPAGPAPVAPDNPTPVQRRVSSRGVIMVARQRIGVGIRHAGLTVTVTTTYDRFQVYDRDHFLVEVPRTTIKPIARYKARKPEAPRPRAPRLSASVEHE
jgi:hypothetical protein